MTPQEYPDALPPGSTLLWYEIRKVLGKGGFGITYLGRDSNLDQWVAIKEYLPSGFASRQRGHGVRPNTPNDAKTFEWGLDRFLLEAQTLARFKHPAIVRVVSFFRDSNTAYMVMEYEEGEGLDDILKRRKVLPEEEILAFLPSLLSGLEVLHRADFIHRDIKPPNILIRKNGTPVILDFGSARQAIAGQSDQMTSLLSLGYSPFEQYDTTGNRQGPWSDIYALGGVLYRAITGQKPLDAAIRISARLRNERDPMKSAEELGRGRYSVRFLKAIDMALMVLETERPQSVGEWRLQLLGEEDAASPTVLAGQPAGVTVTGVSQSPLPATKRKKSSWRSFIASLNDFGSEPDAGEEAAVAASGPQAASPPVAAAQAVVSKPAIGRGTPSGAVASPPAAAKVGGGSPPPEGAGRSIAPPVVVATPVAAAKPRAPRRGDIWVEPFTKMEFLWIPGGVFMMGSGKNESGRRADEHPAHEVELDGFWMAKYPVTWAQWHKVMKCYPEGEVPDAAHANHPVERAIWEEAQKFLRQYIRLIGTRNRLRLPTEAEWEFAARAGTTASFPFGDDSRQLGKWAWYRDNSDGRTHPVGEKEPNAWGLHDMIGNVWEWTDDWYSESYYARSPRKNPRGAPFGEIRVRRGGCWRSTASICRVAHRNRVSLASAGEATGLRLVRAEEEVK
ncbi:MAG: SUMF1/EgtB/PvdO family nonheme iron enzyme [Magnetococcales bacterium]|nr:SUMF1/EgtB/PvdO family nonheme iron enzyme [Magnetococcales bacterium]MBF0156864.1 SUMF1/EgtB/PvdO family nonheme iron enzyme [Magnetococcales bacterium]